MSLGLVYVVKMCARAIWYQRLLSAVGGASHDAYRRVLDTTRLASPGVFQGFEIGRLDSAGSNPVVWNFPRNRMVFVIRKARQSSNKVMPVGSRKIRFVINQVEPGNEQGQRYKTEKNARDIMDWSGQEAALFSEEMEKECATEDGWGVEEHNNTGP
ncbi:hypothetical protein J6590_034053 [Homalodisca vitripennis]|nr:hypothetical protein J6590_034053 [Homalodisca vitripennis]